ncbi:hypothetical protein MUG84_08980 [Paenibacillus sp. KQZ6P-2]|uniref:SWIM-type domain-containing protein n=1 Tax=Paenibacillus mangrovi TaxID=2931978 RepID=A0A9X1WMZ8_9BACL|nr:hypothetical protein [Paenibacillus mangrovi]MCJ8011874.1 hypothetical protein [Paenibacillus mangrovi]
MIKKKELFELSIVPGWIHAKEIQGQKSNAGAVGVDVGWKVDIPCLQLTEEEREHICERLSGHPLSLYALLKNDIPSWLTEAVSEEYAPRPDQAQCSCGQEGCDHVQVAMEAALAKLRSEPLLRLALVGLTRDNLLNHVFREWAEEVPWAAESGDGEALSKLEEKGKSGPSSGEWLAEAAEQGKLHEPGASYRDVSVNLQAVPENDLEMDDWTELLPRVKAVQQVVRQIVMDASGKAKESLDSIKDSI